jgi:hypothetical protein
MFAFAPRRHGIGGSQEIGIFGGDLQQQPAIVAFCQNASERHVRQITVRARTELEHHLNLPGIESIFPVALIGCHCQQPPATSPLSIANRASAVPL